MIVLASEQELRYPLGDLPSVFISYRHENDAHRDNVRRLAVRLRDAGLDVIFDGFEEERNRGMAPPQGWPLWSTAVAQGNLNGASLLFSSSKAIAERLAGSDPTNSQWQRDLWASYWRIADVCEKEGRTQEAASWWQKAHATLSQMKQRGLHISPNDESFLTQLRAKVEEG